MSKATITKELQHKLNNAADSVSLRQSCFDDLSAIFYAITQAVETGTQEHKLAKVGCYLTDDWANLCECSNDAIKTAIEALKGEA